MSLLASSSSEPSAAFRRLAAIAPLDAAAEEALAGAEKQSRTIKPRRELLTEGAPITETLLILSGWAARVRQLEDGRRQIMSFLIPGDLIGNCRQPEPLAVSSVTALTTVDFCTVPNPTASAALSEAYAVSHAMDEAYLLAQITRLGRLNAEERLADLLLELLDRLSLCGMTLGGRFTLPLTQEVLADAVGLSCVHLNRTIQQLRRQGDITLKANTLTLADPKKLAHRVGHSAVQVRRQN